MRRSILILAALALAACGERPSGPYLPVHYLVGQKLIVSLDCDGFNAGTPVFYVGSTFDGSQKLTIETETGRRAEVDRRCLLSEDME